MQLSFRPKEPLDVAAWYERADAEDKARRDAENARALDKKSVEKGNKDVLFRYHVARVNETEDFGDEAALTDGDFVLGVRPEFLRLSDSGRHRRRDLLRHAHRHGDHGEGPGG